MDSESLHAVRTYLRNLQDSLCRAFETLDGGATFQRDEWQRAAGGGGDTRVLAGGAVLERAGVAFSHVTGDSLPPAASKGRPELAGKPWQAMGVSVVVHPRNPHAPTSHCNVRHFRAGAPGEPPVWWFGGGFDLTPYYGYADDCRHWHDVARDAAGTHHARLKKWCDDYFFLPHRNEPRGIGGLFFDDWHEGGFDTAFAFMRRIGDAYIEAYRPIVERRRATPHGERERDWQLLRRGRYVEFNLVHDRGTLFGLQSGGRTESILMSMPPLAAWRYDYAPAPGTPEAELLNFYLKPRDWTS